MALTMRHLTHGTEFATVDLRRHPAAPITATVPWYDFRQMLRCGLSGELAGEGGCLLLLEDDDRADVEVEAAMRMLKPTWCVHLLDRDQQAQFMKAIGHRVDPGKAPFEPPETRHPFDVPATRIPGTHLWLGCNPDVDAFGRCILPDGVDVVVTCHLDGQVYRDGVRVIPIPLLDDHRCDPTDPTRFPEIHQLETSGRSILFHCQAGVNRSQTLLVAYLMTTRPVRLSEATAMTGTRGFEITNIHFLGCLIMAERAIAHVRAAASGDAIAAAYWRGVMRGQRDRVAKFADAVTG